MTAEVQNNPLVLIVDDEAFFRQIIAAILADSGYRSIEAAAGAEVSKLLAQNEIGLVLTDLEMPGASGLEVLKKVKGLKPEVPVVIISGHEDFYAARGVLSGGAMDYLVKPFDDDELLAVVERGLSQYQENLEARQSRDKAEQLLADLVLLREVGKTASGEVDQETLLNRIVEMIVEAVSVRTVSLMLPAKDGNLRIEAAHGLPDGVKEKAVIKPGDGVSGHVFQTGEPVLLANIMEDGRFVPAGEEGQYSTTSALSLPLKGRDSVIGVLNVNNKADGTALSAHDQHLLATIAHQASLAIENFSLVRQLQTKARELEALNSAKSKLVCNLSHELKTPLTSVLGYSDLLQFHRDQFSEAQLNEYLQEIVDSSQQMERLISGMLLLFSIDSGTAQWQDDPIDVTSVCRQEVEQYRAQIVERDLRLELDLMDEGGCLSGDLGKFKLLIGALIDNAVKFNERGGRLNILTEPRAPKGRKQVYIRVHNDGVHVPAEAAEEIFAQYSQLGEINTSKPEGVGIGLALCRTIVEKMDGEIFLEENDGIGTTFGLLLPVKGCSDE